MKMLDNMTKYFKTESRYDIGKSIRGVNERKIENKLIKTDKSLLNKKIYKISARNFEHINP
jgi:hypothetical protein